MDQTPRETLPIQPDRINKVCMPTQKIYTLSEQAAHPEDLHSIRTSWPQIDTFWVLGLQMIKHLFLHHLLCRILLKVWQQCLEYAQIFYQSLASLMKAYASTHVKQSCAQQVFRGQAG